MLFSSIPFLILFLPLVLLVYYYCPALRVKNYVLLFSSLLFYAWGEPVYVVIMLLSIAFNYRAGLFVADTGLYARKVILATAIVVNLAVLFWFKYLGFALELAAPALRALRLHEARVRDIVMPVGISFYTFQSISYLIDVYKKPVLIQKNIFDLGLYITFFPQLIAGPIVRYHDINAQIEKRTHSAALFTEGAERFIIGLAKKILLANSLAETADGIFALPFESVPCYYAWIAIIAYTLQIYYDFSGYSDMAIGLGKLFGFSIPENFNYPYSAISIRDFWRRWHISLSSWFRDYVYIPLGGNRKGAARTMFNLYLVFFITGLWHGASFSFILWGLGHGALLFIERLFGKRLDAVFKDSVIKKIVSRVYVCLSVTLLWVFFRLSIAESLLFIPKLFGFVRSTTPSFELNLLVDTRFYIFLIAGIVFSFPWWRKLPAFQLVYIPRYVASLCLFILSLCSLANNAYNPFIYFRF